MCTIHPRMTVKVTSSSGLAASGLDASSAARQA